MGNSNNTGTVPVAKQKNPKKQTKTDPNKLTEAMPVNGIRLVGFGLEVGDKQQENANNQFCIEVGSTLDFTAQSIDLSKEVGTYSIVKDEKGEIKERKDVDGNKKWIPKEGKWIQYNVKTKNDRGR